MITSTVKDNSGKEYPAIFNNAVILKLATAESIPAKDILTFLSKMHSWEFPRVLKMYRLMLYVAGVLENKPFEIPEDEFEDWLYLKNQDLMGQLTKVYIDSLPDVLAEITGKKKVTKKATTKK